MFIHKRRLSAQTVYLIFSGASSLFFATIVTVNLVYQVEVAKLNPLQLVLVGTALETVYFLCQVPTGVLADVYSR
jgi:MFS transporter, DHA3 family, tetracycline resistance protein